MIKDPMLSTQESETCKDENAFSLITVSWDEFSSFFGFCLKLFDKTFVIFFQVPY